MAIEGLLPLTELDVQDAEATIATQVSIAQACAKTGAPSLPGVPDIPDMVDAFIASSWEGLKIEIMTECEEFMSKFESGANNRVIKEVNKFVKKLNKFVGKLNALMAALLALLAPLCPIIVVISVIMIVAKVITLIPSFGGGLGAVVVATMPGNIAQAIYTFAVDVLNKINKVPFALIGVMNMIIAIYQYVEMIYDRLKASIQRQQDLLADAIASLLRSAEDWLNIDYEAKAAADRLLAEEAAKLKAWDKFNSDMVQLGKDFKNAVGDITVRLGLQQQINTIESQLVGVTGPGTGVTTPDIETEPTPPPLPEQPIERPECTVPHPPLDALWEKYPESYVDECGDVWVCQETNDPNNICDWMKTSNIMDGTDTTPEVQSPYTDEFGNTWEWNEPNQQWDLIKQPSGIIPTILPPDEDIDGPAELIELRLGLIEELNALGGPLTEAEVLTLDEKDRLAVQDLFDGLGNTIITSLIYPHQDVTVKKATSKKGKRYGFYQSDIKQ